MNFRIVVALAVPCVLILAAGKALAADEDEGAPFLDDRYSIWLGGFFPTVDSRFRLDSSAGVPGDEIDFEDTLGLEDGKNVGFGGFRWRITPRNLVEFELVELNRSGIVGGISNPLQIGDYEIRVGGQIETEFDVAIGRLTYGHTVINTEKSEVALKRLCKNPEAILFEVASFSFVIR